METGTVFNNFDYIVVGVVLLSAALAMMRGFVRELFSLIAWVGAYFVGINFFKPALPWVHRYIKNDQVAEWAAMAVIFTIVLILLLLVGIFVCGFIKGRVLTTIDRSLGFLYGLARGALVISLVYLGASMIFWPDIDKEAYEQHQDRDKNAPPEFLLEAKTRPLMAFGAKMLEPYLPEQLLNKKDKGSHTEETASQPSSDEETKSPIDINKLFNKESDQ